MSGLILPGRFNAQPQHNASIDRQGLGKGVQLLFNPAAGPVDLATGRVWTPGGNAAIRPSTNGQVFSFDGTDDYYAYTGYPELNGNVGTFFMWCPTVGAADSFGHVVFGHSSPSVSGHQVYPGLYLAMGSVDSSTGNLSSWFNTANRSLIFASGGAAATARAYLDGKDSGVRWASAPGGWGSGAKNFNLGRYVGGSIWDFNGSILIAGYTTAVWGATEARAFHENPWQLFKAPARRLWTASSGSEVTGSVAYTNADDISSISGTTTVIGSVSATNANDTVSASGSPVIVGNLAIANSDDSVSASGSVGSAVSGSVSYTNGDDTASASGTTTVIGSVSVANADDSVSASGTTTVIGSVAATNADDTVSASGTVEEIEVIGTVSVTNADDTSTASGTTTIVGSVAYLNRNDTSSAEGLVNNGTLVESTLTTGITQSIRIKKPGIPVNTPEWLRTMLEILIGRRGNKITPVAFQELTFSATPTQAECEALYQYMNEVRTAVNEILTRLDS